MLTLVPVQSSNIAAIGYDSGQRRLAVQFKGDGAGRLYHYDNVSVSDHADLVGAQSIGTHFATHIRGKFPHRQVS